MSYMKAGKQQPSGGNNNTTESYSVKRGRSLKWAELHSPSTTTSLPLDTPELEAASSDAAPPRVVKVVVLFIAGGST